ncbi:hypothetical protein FSP39_001687 [Pinctada imbricata]|uniref:YqaJ viral recombinase domain-containing protein n=1 Tax=Pinctada imbricata TaxID=66713 RepID=A0AA88YMS5_PINIB|nr:hypothetical protein FSP39_001687 [Pinctada imbricata]
MAYGPEALDVTEDVSSSELATLQTKFLDNHVNLSSNQCQIISNSTINQSQSGLWYAERKKRITASNFGLVVKRNPSLPVQKFVKTLLYSTFHGNRHTRNGLLQEDTTIEEYKLKMAEQKENVVIERSGLIIHPQHKYLAGSPDGIVATSGGESGLIEIKNLLHSKPVNLWQASENPSFCLENSNGNLNLKSNHNYYYQRRKKTAKFVGRCIRHEWIVDEDTQEKQWYTGTVISLISGCDGHINAVYEVVYDGEDEPYEIDHLMQDYHSGSVTFADI